VVLIPFNLPEIGATSVNAAQCLQSLKSLRNKSSAAIGWIISLAKEMNNDGMSTVTSHFLPMILDEFKGSHPRFVMGYAILLYFVEKVC
jgi:hypothetical protein